MVPFFLASSIISRNSCLVGEADVFVGVAGVGPGA